jgi:hypothetical protein
VKLIALSVSVAVTLLAACSPTTEPLVPTGPMDWVIASDAGDVVRPLSDVERSRVATRLIDESSPWLDSEKLPGKDTVVMIRGERFQLFVADGRLVVCGHALGCREKLAPTGGLAEVIER